MITIIILPITTIVIAVSSLSRALWHVILLNLEIMGFPKMVMEKETKQVAHCNDFANSKLVKEYLVKVIESGKQWSATLNFLSVW